MDVRRPRSLVLCHNVNLDPSAEAKSISLSLTKGRVTNIGGEWRRGTERTLDTLELTPINLSGVLKESKQM